MKKLSSTRSVETNWKITTKYYEIEVEVKRLTLPFAKSRSLKDVECEFSERVIDIDQECSFLEVKKWFEEFGNSRTLLERYLVLVHGNGEFSEGEWIQEAKNWALDHGFESIEAALHDPELESRLAEEDQGAQRLLSALEAHVWPGCQSKSRGSLPQTTYAAQQEPEDEGCFEKLIIELSSARERIRSLPNRKRRKATAEIALRSAQYFDEDVDDNHQITIL